MKTLKILFILSFVFAVASAFISRPSSSKLVYSGWGKFNGVCQQLPIDGGFDCSVMPVGIACTVSKGAFTTATAYSTQNFCLQGTSVGVLRHY